ncbi:MAG: hypothetical protein DRP94_00295 [Candidatus Latescibacterota bacterium]|nr:MAG: hypothetical protein DRP94_00295 [Candidatus Latescibacterota bacterium]RKY72885.1 MAG: hypothetical protein DRQ14_05275 [Candidatus Latescibacterota bacterium]HDH99631.1 hypothetical protein [Bacillota bacterium]
MTAGTSAVCITPSVGLDNMGDYLRLKPALGVEDELFAKALVLEDGERKVAIVTADIIAFTDELTKETRRRIEELTGIKGENVLLSASHTHSSPAVAEKDGASRDYLTELSKKIAGAVFMADRNRREALVGCGVGEAKVSINRWQRKDGGVRWGPNPEAPVDHDVLVMRVDDARGRPMAILVNFASHPSILGADNLLYSGDYVSHVQGVIEKVYDGDVTAMFTTGAGGDVKIAVLTEDGANFRYGDPEDCRRFGTIIAAEALKVAQLTKPKQVRRVEAKTRKVELPLVELPSADEIEAELRRLERAEPSVERSLEINWARDTLEALREGRAPKSIPAEVQLLRIGEDVAFFAVPGELFVEVGIKLKQAMKVPCPFVVAYANGSLGYLPSKRAEEWGWCRHDTSYRLSGRPANFSGAVEEVLLEALFGMMEEGR